MTPDHHAHVLPLLRYQLGQATIDGDADRQAALRRAITVLEQADAPDPILAWLEREAAEARRVLEAERDPGNIEIMRQWVYHHECMVRKRLDELGLLDVDDEPAGGE